MSMFKKGPSFADEVIAHSKSVLEFSRRVIERNDELIERNDKLIERINELEREAAKIVRCGECGYYRNKNGFCIGLPTEPVVMRRPDDFCSRGCRRKSDEDTSNRDA